MFAASWTCLGSMYTALLSNNSMVNFFTCVICANAGARKQANLLSKHYGVTTAAKSKPTFSFTWKNKMVSMFIESAH
jgi:hypothetical protein